MIKNYLKIGIRNIKKQKIYSFINVFGLSIGIACCILIYLFIKNEFTYDTFHKHHKRIYNVAMAMNDNVYISYTPNPLAEVIRQEIPGAENAVRYGDGNSTVIKIGDHIFSNRIHFADPGFFDMFDFHAISGNPSEALKEPNAVLITESIRNTYFDTKHALDQIISVRIAGSFQEFVVKGILENTPENSSMKFNIVLPYVKHDEYYSTVNPLSNWEKTRAITFVLAEENTNITLLTENLNALAAKYPIATDAKLSPSTKKLKVQRLTDIHFNKAIANFGMDSTSKPQYSYILGAIALAVLFVACVNFMNLSMGLSSKRVMEVGIRKTFGAQKKQLRKQFWFESLIMSFIALIAGLMFTELFLPAFNSLAGVNLELTYANNLSLLLALLGLVLVVGVLAGGYPSLILSRLQPGRIFRGNIVFGGRNFFSRSLIVVQFAMSIFLILSSVIMTKQLTYMGNKELGFNSENVVVAYAVSGIDAQVFERLKNKLGEISSVRRVTGSNGKIFGDNGWPLDFLKVNGKRIWFPYIKIDTDYIETLDIRLVAGRDFSEDFPSDLGNSVIVNEAYANQYGIKNPVGEKLMTQSAPVIIGVIKDFHFESLRKDIKPMAFHMSPVWSIKEIVMKVDPVNMSETISIIEKTWREMVPDKPFVYSFLDEEVQNQYRSEQNWKNIMSYTMYFSILIACLGLFGMTSLSTARKVKEIGIRKTLGASVSSIVSRFNKEFVLLLLLANVLCWPVAYVSMNAWLENFAYRIGLSVNVFVWSTVFTLLIAVATISMQAARAALANPVNALRSE